MILYDTGRIDTCSALHLCADAGTPWMKYRSVQTNDRICLTDVRDVKKGAAELATAKLGITTADLQKIFQGFLTP